MIENVHKPHPENCPGDFYVVDGCCVTCGMPEAEAPDIFAWSKTEPISCIVARQPSTVEEINQTLHAMHAAEVDCVRYRGNDTAILRRMAEIGHDEQCDHAPPNDALFLIRDHATFKFVAGSTSTDGKAKQLATDFRADFLREHSRPLWQGSGATRVFRWRRKYIVRISWWGNRYHTVVFEDLADNTILIITRASLVAAGIGLSRLVDAWLRKSGFAEEICWYSASQWRNGGPSQSTVI